MAGLKSDLKSFSTPITYPKDMFHKSNILDEELSDLIRHALSCK
jgi:hypothetical protein